MTMTTPTNDPPFNHYDNDSINNDNEEDDDNRKRKRIKNNRDSNIKDFDFNNNINTNNTIKDCSDPIFLEKMNTNLQNKKEDQDFHNVKLSN